MPDQKTISAPFLPVTKSSRARLPEPSSMARRKSGIFCPNSCFPSDTRLLGDIECRFQPKKGYQHRPNAGAVLRWKVLILLDGDGERSGLQPCAASKERERRVFPTTSKTQIGTLEMSMIAVPAIANTRVPRVFDADLEE